MFQFTGFPSVYYLFHIQIHGSSPCGFPHSDIRGSLDICSSPRLFAAYHVFLRLLVPRHPPCALLCLTFLFFHDCIALQPCSLFSFFASASFSLLSQLSASASHCLSLLSFDVSFSSLNIRFSRYRRNSLSVPMGLSGLEPPTSRLSGVRSNRLSYKPFFFLPGTPQFSFFLPWLCASWRLRDSNSRPPACKAGALPAELSPLLFSSFFLFPILKSFCSLFSFILAATCSPTPSPVQYHRPLKS